MSAVSPPSSRPDLGRSIRLFRLFLVEQSEPDRFYTALAEDSVDQLRRYVPLASATLLDVGGGPGYFGRAFAAAGARYLGLEIDAPSDGPVEITSVRGSGEMIPLLSESVDIAYSSNVLEHVAHPWTMADEMVRVTRPGGVIYLSFTPWLSPWGGHETAPWHLLGGGAYARRRYRRRTGHEPKNRYGETLFGYRVGELLAWARSRDDVEILQCFPRYHPRWAWWIVRVPGLRELAVWNIVMVLRRR
ncbi:class I SAM-dependent methyltransferase [Jatrophihabitans telluris]|uniref:Class I SAM-dependent methyltransferase n=1 Tax=Jatrophihabitans telluris TaxID=2038343 RepID=A0ABY4QUJ7_9ACTN|nr:class I SAM-dependent methyltransferase [Jatrophihabitans telluris]UQX87130.1 class I SAM-dependent methyltransferase [Jatrophihabitans telluris]